MSKEATPFQLYGQAYVRQGYRPIPLDGGDDKKRPAVPWRSFQDNPIPEFLIKNWISQQRGHGIAIVLTDSLVAADLDADDDILKEIWLKCCPSPIVSRVGQKGLAGFYRTDKPLPKAKFLRPGTNGKAKGDVYFELLGHGSYVVIPPSIHPETLKPYFWTPGSPELFEVKPTDHPLITPDMIDRMADELAKLGKIEPRRYSLEPLEDVQPITRPTPAPKPVEASPAPTPNVGATYSGADRFVAMNQYALTRLGDWVPAWAKEAGIRKLAPQAGGFVCLHWVDTGRDMRKRTPNVNIHARGITIEAGMAERSSGWTPTRLVEHSMGKTPHEAMTWLENRLGVTFEDNSPPIVLREDYEIDDDPGIDMSLEVGEDLIDEAPWFVNRLALSILQKHPETVPALALGATLAYCATLFSRRYVARESPTRLTAPNLFVATLAPSGVGKSGPLRELAFVDQMTGGDSLGPSEITTPQAIYKQFELTPSILFRKDEFGVFLQTALSSAKAGRGNGYLFKSTFLELFSASTSFFNGKVTASGIGNIQPIDQPCLSIYGTSTPTEFNRALSLENVSDGLLARFLVFQTASKGKPPTPMTYEEYMAGSVASATLAPGIEQFIHTVMDVAAKTRSSTSLAQRIKPIEVDMDQDALAAYQALLGWQHDQVVQLDEAEDHTSSIYRRVGENTLKVALIAAVATNPESPVITGEAFAWAQKVVQLSVRTMRQAVIENITSNDFAGVCKSVLKVLNRKSCKGGAPFSLIAKECQAFRSLDHQQAMKVLTTLSMQGEIVEDKSPRTGRPPAGGRWVARKFVKDPA